MVWLGREAVALSLWRDLTFTALNPHVTVEEAANPYQGSPSFLQGEVFKLRTEGLGNGWTWRITSAEGDELR